jgi:hypothetical protein
MRVRNIPFFQGLEYRAMNLKHVALMCAMTAWLTSGAVAADPSAGQSGPTWNQGTNDSRIGGYRSAARYQGSPSQAQASPPLPPVPGAPPAPSAAEEKAADEKADSSCEKKDEACEEEEEECEKCKCKTGCWLIDSFGKPLCETHPQCCLPGCIECKKPSCEEEPTCKADEGCTGEDEWEIKHWFNNCCFAKKWRIDTGGWLDQSYTQNFSSPSDHYNGPVTWEDRSNQYQLNELYLYTGRATDTSDSVMDLGFRVDALYGTSARFDTSAGLEDRINKSQTNYGLALPQAYIEGAWNSIKVKMGHFISPVGYFTVGSYNNFFNTIPYTYQWGEPFTHTGMLATWTATNNLVLGGGFTRGWDNSGNFNPNLGTLFTATYSNLAKEGDSLAYVNMYSHEPNGGFQVGNGPSADGIYPGKPTFSSRYFQTLVYSRPITDKITYVIQSDLGVQGNAAAGTANGHNVARWYGINQYAFYKVSNKVAWGFNYEWFRDEEGFRTGGFLPDYTNDTNGGPTRTRGYPLAAGGFAGNFYQCTMGPRFNPVPNLVIRPNFRFDWYSGPNGTHVDPNTGANYRLPFDAGRRREQGLFVTDIVLVF